MGHEAEIGQSAEGCKAVCSVHKECEGFVFRKEDKQLSANARELVDFLVETHEAEAETTQHLGKLAARAAEVVREELAGEESSGTESEDDEQPSPRAHALKKISKLHLNATLFMKLISRQHWWVFLLRVCLHIRYKNMH